MKKHKTRPSLFEKRLSIAKLVLATLNELYPDPAISLDHSDPYTLLIAVLLSARCTDKTVNRITPELFAQAKTAKEMVQLPIPQIQAIIKPCGLSLQKASHIRHLSQILVEKYGGQVPKSFEELEALPGIGHKSASVVLSQAFAIPAFPVDTHIFRLARRFGLSQGKTVKQVEEDLKTLFDPSVWIKLHLQLIYFGREYCKALRHNPLSCPICSKIDLLRNLFSCPCACPCPCPPLPD